jgi:hypothetical protein
MPILLIGSVSRPSTQQKFYDDEEKAKVRRSGIPIDHPFFLTPLL